MWKCPRPRPNHKGAPTAQSLCRGDPINTVSSPVFSLLAGWLRRAAFNAGMESYSYVRVRLGRRDPTHHYRSDGTLRIVPCFYITPSAPGDAVSSEQFQRISCCSSRSRWRRLPLRCPKIFQSCVWKACVRLCNECSSVASYQSGRINTTCWTGETEKVRSLQGNYSFRLLYNGHTSFC